MKHIITIVSLVCLCILKANAEGYQVNTLSARQLGMAHAGTALNLGAESMIFNPGALGFSNKNIELTGSVTAISSKATSEFSGNEYHTHNSVSTPLAFNASFKVSDNLQAGLSFYTPYGSSINWTRDWPGAVLNQSVDLKVYTLQPTISWKIAPRLSVGAGLMMTWGSVNLNKGLVSPSTMDAVLGMMSLTGMSQQLGVDPDYRFGHTSPASVNLKGKSDIAIGFNIGALYEISERLSAGVSFRSKMQVKVRNGEAGVNYANDIARIVLEKDLKIINAANFKSSMPAPYVLNLGIAYKPIKPLIIALDAQLTGWKTYKMLNIDFLNDKLDAYDQKLTKKYHNSWCFRLGAQYAVTDKFEARAGMMVDLSPVNSNHYNPETPGMTKLGPSVGISFRPVPALSVDLGFMYIAGLGKDNASCTYPDLLAAKLPALGLASQQTFTASYRVHAFSPSIGLRYAF